MKFPAGLAVCVSGLAACALGLAGCAGRRAYGPPGAGQAAAIRLADEEIERIAARVYRNEAGGKPEFLLHWNEGEEFASLGIGHFIWYPKGYLGPFDESFPKLLRFLAARGAAPPEWLRGDPPPPCPWASREQFLRARASPRSLELQRFLEGTTPLQARFLAARLEGALPKMLEAVPEEERGAVRSQFYRVAAAPLGLYALLDYVNFKGEGTKQSERYNGQGWGLLQVLQGMKGAAPGRAALEEFAESAEAALTRRVRNSPPERHEERWLPGWRKRLESYREGG